MEDNQQKLIKVRFAEFVKSRREKLGLRQEEFAYRCGLHAVSISRIENGKTAPTVDTVVKIAKGFNIDHMQIFAAIINPFQTELEQDND
ncbi:helix-turn-helix transcriptional regulator [Bacillaceae bacterium IKA-2]|nr:helix-turn-helix transcriptional regulator [Bacillaceae bacterium IKA-2]